MLNSTHSFLYLYYLSFKKSYFTISSGLDIFSHVICRVSVHVKVKNDFWNRFNLKTSSMNYSSFPFFIHQNHYHYQDVLILPSKYFLNPCGYFPPFFLHPFLVKWPFKSVIAASLVSPHPFLPLFNPSSHDAIRVCFLNVIQNQSYICLEILQSIPIVLRVNPANIISGSFLLLWIISFYSSPSLWSSHIGLLLPSCPRQTAYSCWLLTSVCFPN